MLCYISTESALITCTPTPSESKILAFMTGCRNKAATKFGVSSKISFKEINYETI